MSRVTDSVGQFMVMVARYGNVGSACCNVRLILTRRRSTSAYG